MFSPHMLNAEQFKALREYLDSAVGDRSLLPGLDGLFPSTEGYRFTCDVARILDVDPSTGTLRLACLHLNSAPANVQWLSPMLDPRTGHGQYFVPKPGMYGLYFNVGGADFFWGSCGITEVQGDNLFLNRRETLPEGAHAIRTSSETKQIWSPNLLLIQAANFCKVVMKRVNKALDVLFYQLTLTSLGGSLKWTTDITAKLNLFRFKLRNRLSPSPDVRGRKKKSDPSREISVKVGADALDDSNFVRLTMARVTGPGQGNTLETEAVQRLRKLVYQYCERKGVNSGTQIQQVPALSAAFGDFVTPAATTLETVVEAIVGSATFVRQAVLDGINGITDLAPAVNSVEDLQTGLVSPLGNRSPYSLSAELEQFVEANRLEIRKDSNGVVYTTVGSQLVRAARAGTADKNGVDVADKLLELEIDEEGRFTLTGTDPAAEEGAEEEVDPPGKIKLDLPSLFQLCTRNGSIDLDSKRGLRLRFQEGGVILGNDTAGIIFTKDGGLELRGKHISQRAYSNNFRYDSAAFETYHDKLEDFYTEEFYEWEQPMRDRVEKAVKNNPKFYKKHVEKYQGKTYVWYEPVGYPNSPLTDPKTKTYEYINELGRSQSPVWLAYEAKVLARTRAEQWYRRRLLYDEWEKYAPLREKKLEEFNAKYGPKQDDPAAKGYMDKEVTDNATALQMGPTGIMLTTNGTMNLRSGVSTLRMESSQPGLEKTGTRREIRDRAYEDAGVPFFSKLDEED